MSEFLIDEQKLDRVRQQIADILIKEFPDPDGDPNASQVEFVLVDRSRCWQLGYRPVPYYPPHHEKLTAKQLEELQRNVQSLLIYHVSRAADDLERFHRLLRVLEQEKKR